MNSTILLIPLALVFALFCFFIFYAMKGSGKKPAKVIDIAGNERFQLEVKPKDDGVEILVYNSYQERPSDAELFPDILNDLAPSKDVMDRAFWDRVAHIGEVEDPAEREKLVRMLADAGVIPPSAVDTWTMPDPNVDREPDEGPDDDYRNVLSRVDFDAEPQGGYVFEY